MNETIKPYHQKGNTCAIACMLMVLEYYKLIPEANKYYENKYYRIYKSQYMEGTPLSAIAWHLSKNGISTEIIHSNKEIFKNDKGLIDNAIFDDLMNEYQTFLNQAEKVGCKISNGVDINLNFLKSNLNKGKLIILAGQIGKVLHTVLISGCDSHNFIVYDPLFKEKRLWNEEQVKKFMNTDIGKWCIFLKKVNR